MANEATIRSSLQIQQGEVDYSSRPAAFTATVTGSKGPTPGAVLCSTAGTDIDLTELTTPSLCRIQNLDAANRVEVGIWDPETSKFYPLLELLAGESYVVRLCRLLGWEYGTGTGAGTGTTGPNTNRLRIRANTAACNVLVEAFEI